MRLLPASTIRTAFISCAASALITGASLSYADDTEIFFGGPSIADGIRPNVLFILDNSGSMAWRTTANNNPSGSEKSRMQILKESFSEIINNAGAINAGIMVLNSRSEYNNTRMVYPVTYIDEALPTSVTQVASNPEILESGDDATQSSLGGGAVINGTSLQMGYITTSTTVLNTQSSDLLGDDAFFKSSYSGKDWACRMNASGTNRNSTNPACNNSVRTDINIREGSDTNTGDANPIIGTALLYFRNLNIPAAARLDPSFQAYLDLRPINTQSGGNRPTISVTMENSKTPQALNDRTQIEPRTYLTTKDFATTTWNANSTTRLDVTNLFKQALGNDAAALQQVFLKLRDTNGKNKDYNFCVRGCPLDSGVTTAPRLVISFNGTAPATESKSVALRFQNVGIPQGATVQSARIDFAPATSNADPLTLQVRAEKVSDAAVFTAGSNVTGRTPKTSALATWAVPAWVNQSPSIHEPGPDVTSVVQEVVSNTGWCGNNSMAFFIEPSTGTGSRTSHSIDGAPGLQPTLTVTYTGGASGCLNPIIDATVASPKDDAFEASNGSVTLDGTTLPVERSRFAARFIGVPLLKGATILDAKLILTPANSVTMGSSISTKVRFDDSANSAAFTNSYRDLYDRPDTSDTTCTISNWVTATPVICDGSQLKTSLQSIINKSDWAPGNAITVMSLQSSDSNLQVQAYENNPAQAIKLRIKVASGGVSNSAYTVRQHLNALVQSMSANNGTPIVPTLNEASEYLSGNRSGYSSPITSACQPTHIVLLTDGQANGNDNTTRNNIAAKAGSCSTPLVSTGDDPGIADNSNTDSDEKCGRKLVEWMAQTDQSSLPDDSFINTHTIGFALGALAPSTVAATFLSDLSDNGNGGTYTAENASDLTKAFSDILQSVQDVDTTFVSASAPVNSFERQNNKDELYFSLFSPAKTHRWPGNLKRYRFAITDSAGNINPQIVDADGYAAVGSSGNFVSTAKSFWSSTTDGNDSAAGGAASKLPTPDSRKLYTNIGTSPSSPVSLSTQPLTTGNANITNTMINAADDDERLLLFKYIRGLDPTSNAERKAIGDPIHASPRLATYSCITANAVDATKCDKDDQTAYIGTNEGFVQAINTDTGAEVFAYMPKELLSNIKKLKENATTNSATNPRPYGMDNPVTLWVNDVNKDGKILNTPSSSSPQAGEFIYAYATMGRGGRGLYALDVTNRNNPKLMWYIKGGETTGFEKLGQTWSAPVKAKIKVGAVITDVLVFAGGYDSNQDEVDVRTADTQGNALYVVDAITGALIWSASNETATATRRQMSKMVYSMPATPRVIDLQTAPTGTLIADADKLADQIFVGDMGGQVWRFYINNGQTGVGLITAGGSGSDGVFATAIPSNYSSLDLLGKQQNLRRFYNEPDVALLNKDGKLSLSINIGSGYRGHPLNTSAQDKFYSFRTSNLTDPTGSEGTLTSSDLLNITSNLSPSTTDQVKLSLSDDRAKGGWYMDLSSNLGEKVLTRALTAGVENTLFFSTYQPAVANSNSCEAAFGTARGYAIDLFDGSPAYPANPDNPTLSDRFDVLKVPGLPPQPEMICIGDNCFIIKGPGDIDEVKMPKLGKMYWIDSTEIKPAP